MEMIVDLFKEEPLRPLRELNAYEVAQLQSFGKTLTKSRLKALSASDPDRYERYIQRVEEILQERGIDSRD